MSNDFSNPFRKDVPQDCYALNIVQNLAVGGAAAVVGALSAGSFSLANQSLTAVAYQDVMTGATGGSPALSSTTHNYPYSAVTVNASGDAVVSAFAPFTDVYGVSAFTDASHGNVDPIRIFGAYNMTTTTRTKAVAGEPAFGLFIETNYLVPSDSYTRQMEFYVNFNSSSGNPGTENRVLNISYAPGANKVTTSSIKAADQSYGGSFEFRNSTGIAGTKFAEIGFTGTGGGNINGVRHYGSTTEDTVFDIQAGTGRQSYLYFGSNGTVGAVKVKTASAAILGVDIGSVTDKFRIQANDGGMNLAIGTTDNLAGLSVKPMSASYATIRAQVFDNTQALPCFQARNASDAQTAGIYGQSGAILSKGASGGVGYETGAGGNSSQSSSKSTTVTASPNPSMCGAITMNNAALNAGTIVSFTFTNSAIAATDVLVLNHISGGTIGAYTLNAQCGNGSATINVRNNTGGSLSEALVIQYAIIKGVNS